MRTYRFKRRTSAFGLFVGLTATAERTAEPPLGAERVTGRVWLDATHVVNQFTGAPTVLGEEEIEALRGGLREVARDVERSEHHGHVVIAVRGIEIAPCDYVEAGLGPAIVGWAAEEFDFTPRQVTVRCDERTGRFTFDMARQIRTA